MSAQTNIAVIGAGPYGLSISAHLQGRGLDHRIFGAPMRFWSAQMPRGMLLKSEGFASNLYEPENQFTLRQFCQEHGIEYADLGLPVRLETFCAYGTAFQERFVPKVESTLVSTLRRSSSGFRLQLETGETITARKVVVATGLSHFHHMPAQLGQLPAPLVSHSSQHGDLSRFKAREVAVIGAGASAIDVAALLFQGGASVHLIARKPLIKLHGRMQLPRPLGQRLRHPISAIGPGWRSLFYSDLPALFHHLPARARTRIVDAHLGPAGGWFMKDGLAKVAILAGHRLAGADVRAGRVRLALLADDGRDVRLDVDHVIAATGYRVDLRRLPLVDPELLSDLRLVYNAPVLSSQFESSLPGLFWVGAAAANSFGPVMRFAVGARFSAPRIAKFLAT